jgi:hypothetical protein
VVSYHGYTTRDEAYTALSIVQSSENITAWVLEK